MNNVQPLPIIVHPNWNAKNWDRKQYESEVLTPIQNHEIEAGISANPIYESLVL